MEVVFISDISKKFCLNRRENFSRTEKFEKGLLPLKRRQQNFLKKAVDGF